MGRLPHDLFTDESGATGEQHPQPRPAGLVPSPRHLLLTLLTALLAAGVGLGLSPWLTVVAGLALFGVIFAVNSSVHSYLILAYTDRDQAALNVGFYYMANAIGRLVGTLLSGWVYQLYGLGACLWISSALVGASALMALALPREASAR